MLKKSEVYTVPNFISFYRLLAFPFILWMAVSGLGHLFVIFLIINLVSDVLDGLIARTFKCETELGARLDSFADIGTYICAITGVVVFKYADIQPYLILFVLFVSLFFIPDIVSLIKFGIFSSFHLYSWKIGGYLQGGFLIVWFTSGFSHFLFYFTLVWTAIAFAEHIIIQMLLPEMKSNVKGLYWVLKAKRRCNE